MSAQKIKTERLVMRPANNDEDLTTFKQLLEPCDYLFQYGYEYDEHLLDGYDFTSLGVICYSVFLKDTDEYIGYVGIKPNADDPGLGELEYFISRSYRNKGYCHEAARALIDAFKDGLLTDTRGIELYAETISENAASARVLEKLGFRFEHNFMTLCLCPDPTDPDGYKTAGNTVSAYKLDLRSSYPPATVYDFEALTREEELLACA